MLFCVCPFICFWWGKWQQSLCGLTITPQVALEGMETSPILSVPADLLVRPVSANYRSQEVTLSQRQPLICHLFGVQKHSEVAGKLSSAVEISSACHCPSEFQAKELGASFAALADALTHVFKIH